MLTDFTSYAEIRAVLGVSSTELPDTVLAQPQWMTLLSIDLEDLHAELETLYMQYVDLYGTMFAEPPDGSYRNERRFYNLARLYASYVVAQNLLGTLTMFSVQTLTDGRASFTRQTDIFADVREAVTGMLTTLKVKLSAAYVVLAPTETAFTTTSFTYTTSTGIATSPVTNA